MVWEEVTNSAVDIKKHKGKIYQGFYIGKREIETKIGKQIIYSFKVPLWTFEGQERYVRARLKAHKALNPSCSDEERWLHGKAWAVYKGDNQKAFRVFDNEKSANKLAETDKTFRVVYRAGTYNRCDNYCIVSKFCPQVKREKRLIHLGQKLGKVQKKTVIDFDNSFLELRRLAIMNA